MSHRILLVDDEVDILEFVRYNLVREGYEVFTAENGAEALKVAAECRPHLILLDMMMPVMDGAQTCRAIRRNPVLKDTMVVFLSALGEEGQQLAGFDVGADDYLTKPIKMKLLVSRVQAILKRIDADRPPEKAPAPGLTVDRERYTVIRDGQEITLPRKEFALLDLLHSSPGKLIPREEIYAKIWGTEVVVGDRTIDVHIRKLRQKIGDERIVTVKGVGYKYEPWIVIPGRAEGPTWESAERVVRLRPLIGLPRRHAPRNDGRGGQATESVCPDEAILNCEL